MKKRTKILSLILTLVMLVPLMTPMLTVETSAATVDGAWDGSVASAFAGGNGNSGTPYLIETPAQLAYLAKLINDTKTSASYVGKSYRLMADIDLGGREWTPIGATMPASQSNDTYQRFAGVFDGNGHSITNFKITKKQTLTVGFFTITQNATIKNLTIQGKVTAGLINTTPTHIPGIAMLAGTAYSSTIDNVTIYSNIAVKSSAVGQHWVGAVAGYATGGTTIKNCNLYGTIETKLSAGTVNVGGVAGHARKLTLTNVQSDIDISVRDASDATNSVGGLVGYFYSDPNTDTTKLDTLTIQGCSVTGDISINSARTVIVGGLAGTLGSTPQKTYQKDENGNNVTDANGNLIITDISYTTGGKATIENNSFDGTIRATVEANIGVVRQGLIAGNVRTYEASFKNFFTSATGTLYNKEAESTNLKWGTDTTTVPGKTITAYSMTDHGGHITGISIASDYGVAVRFTPSSPGLRFNSMINKTLYNSLKGNTAISIKLGTLIAPTAYVEAVGGFDAKRLAKFATDNGFQTGYIDVPFVPNTNEWLNEYLDGIYDATVLADNNFFSGAISNIAEQNYNRTFSGIGYVTIVSGGYEFPFYADYTDSSRSRTVGYVANAATNDRKTAQGAGYENQINDGNANGAYSPYTATQINTIKKYVEAYDPQSMETAPLTIVDLGVSNYSIVYPFSASEEEQALAAYLQHAIKSLTGADLPIRENLSTAVVNANEIVVGCSDRVSSYRVSQGNFGSDYSVLTSGSRVLINGKDAASLSAAILTFIQECFGVNLTTANTVTTNSSKTYKLDRFVKLLSTDEGAIKPLTGLSMSGYRIGYTSSNYVHKRMAVSMRDRYQAESGTTLTLSTTTSTLYNRIAFTDDATLKNGDWKIATTKASSISSRVVITISAGSYYGFEGAEDFLMAAIKYGLAPVTTAGFTMTGNYKAWVGGGRESTTQYAYEKNGDMRIMYYNVLWNGSQSSGDKTWNTPVDERNTIQATMIKQYMPDVLALQEFNLSRRGGDISNLNGGLVAEMINLGYTEAVDPRVHNAYETSQTIPGTNGLVPGLTQTYAQATTTAGKNADYVSGGSLKGYGTSGAYSVTVNSESFKTYLNCAPLFYNANTTKCLAAEYYWYKAQTDYREGSTHENGASDAGSKAATWGLFQDLATKRRYIVIGTHMCTRSDYIRELQAREMEALIDSLIATYNVPVFLGGDLNSSDANGHGGSYRYFANVAGYADLQSTEIANMYTSSVKSSHSYPDNTGTSLSILQPETSKDGTSIATENSYFSSNSIDRILLSNHSKVEVNVFGVVFDEFTRVGSDHMPVFADFNILSHGDYTKPY